MSELLTGLQNEQRGCVWYSAESGFSERPLQRVRGILSGSFNPLHQGHEELADVAGEWLGGSVAFELSIRNVDKPAIDLPTVQQRLEQFSKQPVVVTRMPRFVEKSALFAGHCFVVGADTAVRIVDGRFYETPADLYRALDTIRWNGCSFLVAARLMNDRVLTLGDANVPSDYEDLFEAIPEADFRLDISSAQLRNPET